MPKKQAVTLQKSESSEVSLVALKSRLDAIVLLLLQSVYADKDRKIKISEAAPLLHLAGYSPTEIAKLFGKKKATEVATYLYPKKR